METDPQHNTSAAAVSALKRTLNITQEQPPAAPQKLCCFCCVAKGCVECVFLPQPFELCVSVLCLTLASADARGAELVVRYNALIESLRAVHRMLRRGRVSRGIQMLEEALDGVLSDATESDEPAEAMPASS